MKRLNLFLSILIFFILPFHANADIIFPVEMTLSATSPVGNITLPGYSGGVYLDYELSSDLLDSVEAFCVENADGWLGTHDYTLITLDEIDASLRDKYQAAANIAEVYYDASEVNKAAAQVAIWETIFDWNDDNNDGNDDSYNLDGGDFSSSYETNLVNSILGFSSSFAETNNWWLAVSPATIDGSFTEGVNGQNYLVRRAAPVPEPATMLLLGTGLIGLASVGRKKFINK